MPRSARNPGATHAPDTVPQLYTKYPEAERAVLLGLRRLILEAGRETEGVGALNEAVKWGEPAFLTPSGSGTTIRIAGARKPGYVGLYVHCQTTLIAEYRALYPQLEFEGNRAILLPLDQPLPEVELRHAIALALTYKRRKPRWRKPP